MRRREFVVSGALGVGALGFGPGLWRAAMAAAAPAELGPGPYGPLLEPDENGIRLPEGFSSRLIARANRPIQGTGYALPWFPDGAATYPRRDGGWILAVNSEVPLGLGGASAIQFSPEGEIEDAYRILGGTSTNCAGGRTPWGTWLSCEEVDNGWVFECDPTGATAAIRRDALGRFKHEAACVDPQDQRLYLTEDDGSGGLYRFTPDTYPNLANGVLEIATVAEDGAVTWTELPDPTPGPLDTPTREQVPGSTVFRRGEGIWYDAGWVYVATTGDETIHAYEVETNRIEILYRQELIPESPLQGVDNITVSQSGDLFVCEDDYDNDPDAMDVCMITREGEVARFAKLTGEENFVPGAESEITGVAFDPSGTRMYFGSQRAWTFGAIWEVTGPFRLDRPPGSGPGRPGTVDPEPLPCPVGAAIGLEAPRRIEAQKLAGRGLPLAFTLEAEATVSAILTARMPRRDGGRERVVLGRGRQTLGAGPGELRLAIRNDGRRRAVRRTDRPVDARLEVEVTGCAKPVRRKLRIVPSTPRL